MIAIPTLRRSENHVSDLSRYQGMPCDDLTARQEYGRWVPRDVHGFLIGDQSYFSISLMRSEYPGIKLINENGEELCDD